MSSENVSRIQSATLKEILLATPYEALFNLDGFLNEEEFRKYFLVKGKEAPGFEASIQELYEAMFSSSGFDNIILLHGYKGTGKTTLLREFIARYSSEIANAYIDFHEARPDFAEENRAASFIADLLRFQFLNKETERHRYHTLGIIKKHLKSFPISNQFFNLISSESEIKGVLYRMEMRESHLKFSDWFILYMTLLFVKVKDTQFDGHHYIVIFDNLDAVDVEFVTPYFLDEFSRVLEATARLSQRDIFGMNPQFTRRFRFIFAVREGNYSLLSVHFSDRLRGKIRTLDVPFYLTPGTRRAIISKRLSFYQESIRGRKNSREINKVSFIVKQWIQEPLFENILASSFNGDYRKIIEAIFILVRKLKSIDKRFWRQQSHSPRESYGAFGTLIRGAIDYWFPYFKPYYLDTPPDITRSGYFHPIRMVLNLVLNLSQGGISTYRSHYEHEGYSDLYTLSRALIRLYPCSVILRTIARLFLLHKNWVHLLSIYADFPIDDEYSLIKRLLRSCPRQFTVDNDQDITETDENMLANCLEECEEVKTRFERIRIKITPAGIAYLKHLHIHFEFYSALAGEQTPLFVAGETALQKGEGFLQEVEEIIERVFRVVKNHHKIILRFYKYKFEKERKYDADRFLSSNYAFLFLGRRRANRGQFHITRVITAHIDYIDNLRLFMIGRVRDGEDNFDDLIIKDRDRMIKINKRMLNFLKKYIYLLGHVPDPRARQWVEILLKQVRRIESSEYRDINTRVYLPKH